MPLDDFEALIDEMESLSNAEERQRLFRAFGVVVGVHREALARIVEIITEAGQEELLERFLADELVASLLRGYRVVEDEELTGRVERVLEESRPYLRRHGGDVNLLSTEGGIARLEMTGSCDGCAASMITLKQGIEKALYEGVPDLRGVEVEGLTDADTMRAERDWMPLVPWSSLHDGEWMRIEYFDDELLVCTVDQRPFAFLNRCPAGGESLHEARFDHLSVTCSQHDETFDLRTGAAASDSSRLRLRMFPLIVENSVVKIGR